ncbi:MAG: hypothetical protein WC326_12095 [Candidatus Delongbacteria bacterium]
MTTQTRIRLAPVILCALYAVFLAVFALDAFDPDKGRWAQWLAFGVHLLPSAFILLVLILAWRREWVGSTVYAGLGLGYVFMWKGHWLSEVLVAGPLFLISLLFLWSWRLRRREARRTIASQP